MKFFKKLKAFFYKDENPVELALKAAEIREGYAYLHPKGDNERVLLVRSDDIEIHLSRGKSLADADVIMRKLKKKDPEKSKQPEGKIVSKTKHIENETTYERYKKRTFTVSLYQEEYDALMRAINDYGYKRAEFIMASANTATRGTMEKARKKIVKIHKEIRTEERAAKAQSVNKQ